MTPTEEPPRDDHADEVLLRPGVPEDLPEVRTVFLAASDGPGQPRERRTTAEVTRWLEGLAGRGQEMWVAERAGELLGFVTLQRDWVPLLFVHPTRPARGVGVLLIDLVKALRPGGFGLRVLQHNERARAFYRRHGLVELEATDGAGYQDGEPDLQMAWLGEDPLAYLRRRIDEVDDELAVLLARRVALAGTIQERKEVGGHAGRDRAREQQIVDRMQARVPALDPDLVAVVVHTLIEQSLALWERG